MSARATRARAATAALLLTLMSVTACGKAGETITRLAVGDPGPDPYTLAANADDDEQVDRRAEAGGVVEGDAPGLYGGTRKTASCDKNALVRFLEAGGKKAGAWSGALGITPGEIPGFVAELTPAVLRVDTLVTNHGYRDGRATSLPAVLQAGVAVLVDRHGVPVVKCNCGNPLTPPDKEIDPTKSDFSGASWPQFNGGKVTVIGAPEREVKSLKLVDSETETAFERPVGSGGDRDGAAEPIPPEARSEPPVSTSGQPPGPATSGGVPPARSGPATPARPGSASPAEPSEPEATAPETPAEPTGSPTGSGVTEEPPTPHAPPTTPEAAAPKEGTTAEAEAASVPTSGTDGRLESAPGPAEPVPDEQPPTRTEPATRPADPEPSEPGPEAGG